MGVVSVMGVVTGGCGLSSKWVSCMEQVSCILAGRGAVGYTDWGTGGRSLEKKVGISPFLS